MSKVIPKIKKKVNSFLLGEDGKISKASIITAGVLLAGAATMVLNSQIVAGDHASYAHSWNPHTDTWPPVPNWLEHVNHASHASHASY